MIGDILADRYAIEATLGAGGTAVVYRAHDRRLARDVALKVLLPNLARDPVVAARFEREARALAAINHPGIVSIFDVEPGDPAAGREPFYVMELCPDGSLADELSAAGGRLPPETVVPIVLDIAAGLAALHDRGVIHRDVKPHNILLTAAGAKLADFGLARTHETTRFTAPGTAVGTLAYLAPELLDGEPATAASDVYGLGVATFQALTGRLPRPAGSMVDLVDARRAVVALTSAAAPGLGLSFDSAVAATLEVDPFRRPDARSYAGALRAAVAAWRADGSPRPMAAAPVGAGAAVGARVAAGSGMPESTAAADPAPGADARTVAVRVRRSSTGADRLGQARRAVAGGALIGLIAVVVGGLFWLAGIGGPRDSGASPSPTPRASATTRASASASPSASPTPPASPSPTASSTPTAPPSPGPTTASTPTPFVATPTPFGNVYDPVQARAQIANLRTAIANGLAIGQLTKADAALLNRQIDEVENDLNNDRPSLAARSADRLVQTIDAMINAGTVPARGELQNAALALRAALP